MLFSDEEAMPGAEGPLVAVTFQRNPHQKQKYVESQPKALGVTQITLSVFYISSVIVTNGLSMLVLDLPQIIGSVFGSVIIAGSLAIAAQNLHFPTVSYAICKCTSYLRKKCMSYNGKENMKESTQCPNSCQQNSDIHYFAELVLIQTALIAISVTLAAYCCKVVNGPVIKVQVPPAQQ
uniref:Uncharacterized protein n=1 Tax=Salmo trutta TaxID=8032 RepID=A0A674BDC4_SALTR